MKNSRLFQLLYLLMEKREWTAEELAERAEVSKRTIYRDIDALSAAGIPVFSVKGQGGGIRLMEQFKLDRSLLSEEGQDQILTALKSLEAVGMSEHGELLSQLSGLFKKEPADWLEVDFESWGSVPGEKELFELCREAVLKHRLLTMEYCNSSGERVLRSVEPERLCFKGGNWYLSAYCRMRQDFRLFRLNRIAGLSMEEEAFLPRERPNAERQSGACVGDPGRKAWRQETVRENAVEPEGLGRRSSGWNDSWQPEEKISLELLFSEKAAYQVMDIFVPAQIERLHGGGFLVKAVYPPGRWVFNFLLSFGAEMEILKPEWAREELRKEALRIMNLYEKHRNKNIL